MVERYLPQCAVATDAGPRPGNEDYCGCATWSTPNYDWQTRGSVYILADGMGGHGGGEIASRITVQETINAFRQIPSNGSLSARLAKAIGYANSQVISQAQYGTDTETMGSTVVACAMNNGHMAIAHAGDSRAYLLRGGVLQLVTKDHLYVTEVLGVAAEEAESHPMKHVLSRCMGRSGLEVEVHETTVQQGDRILLCSDGLSNALDNAHIHRGLAMPTPEEAVKWLIGAGRLRARDNLSAVVIFVPQQSRSGEGRKSQPKVLAGALVGVSFLALLALSMFAGMGPKGRSAIGPVQLKNMTGGTIHVKGLGKNPLSVSSGRPFSLGRDEWVVYYTDHDGAKRWQSIQGPGAGPVEITKKKSKAVLAVDIK